VPLTESLIDSFDKPHPFCMLRAVPTGTTPVAPPDMPSPWEGVFIAWGKHEFLRVGAGFGATPADTVYDYFVSRAQSKAFNDYWSIAGCGLCDTWLFQPGSQSPSNAIWWGNSALYTNPSDVSTRSAVQIDGANAYQAESAYWGKFGQDYRLADNPGFPAVSETDSVDPATGDLTIDERGAYVSCAEDRSVFPPTDASCASFTDSGVHYERSIHQSNSGQLVTIVDHWKSVDGKPHDLDLLYEDSNWSENSNIAGRESRLNFTWTPDGFKAYAPHTQIPVPPSVPASMLVKTDGSTGAGGDTMNPFGVMTFASRPTELEVDHNAGASSRIAIWHTRYQRTIPAGGEISIAVAYAHDLALAPVQSLRQTAETVVAAPAVTIDSPANGATVDAGSVHVTGSASSVDGKTTVTVNGVGEPLSPDGHWGADVPLSSGTNQILAVASNGIGVTSNAIVSVNKPAPAAVPAAVATVAAKPVRCVVPKLRGKTLAKSKRLLKRAHCRLGKVVRKASTRVKPGRVLSTRFKAGTRHRPGTRIRVTVAKAPRA
jgi:hypothetical protein